LLLRRKASSAYGLLSGPKELEEDFSGCWFTRGEDDWSFSQPGVGQVTRELLVFYTFQVHVHVSRFPLLECSGHPFIKLHTLYIDTQSQMMTGPQLDLLLHAWRDFKLFPRRLLSQGQTGLRNPVSMWNVDALFCLF
jgi:hypothetical protein